MRRLVAFVLVTAVSLTGYSDHHAGRFDDPPKVDSPGLAIGEYKMGRVVDGDTIRVEGLDSSLRLLGLDAEETFKHEKERRAFDKGWEQYKLDARTNKQGQRLARPAKFATPMGDAAREWAIQWFAGVDTVRLERDHPAEIRDRYDRYLAYVLVNKNGVWVDYNIEAVRAGMAPYFPKYGRSRRFHKEFVAAEAEAKAAQRGIWKPGAQAYDDYPEREAWWAARGEFVAKFREQAERDASYIELDHADAREALESSLGKQVVILATVNEVYRRNKGPTSVTLSGVQKSDFPLIFFKSGVLDASDIARWKGEWVRVTGVPSLYENKHTHEKQLQIEIDRASQIELSPVPGLEVESLSEDSPD